MNSRAAFNIGNMSRGKELMVFDWDKAATIIKNTGAKEAWAGLQDDWEWTGGCIYKLYEIVTTDYTYLSSPWAVPELAINGKKIPCYKMQSEVPDWGSSTKWPDSARDILAEEKIS